MSSLSTCAADSDASFDKMPDDIVSAVLGAVAVSARFPSDFLSATMVSKRFLELGMNIAGTNMAGARCFAVRAKYGRRFWRLGQSSYVRKRASTKSLAVPANHWSEAADRFLQCCADAGNMQAGYLLGMIRFYCTREREAGTALILAAAIGGLNDAIYSLAVIVFNGSGGTRESRNIPAAVALCATSASLGSIDALRELGFCMKDGYGVEQSLTDGRRLIVLAKAREMALSATGSASLIYGGCKASQSHANKFMVDWFDIRKTAQPLDASGQLIGEGTTAIPLRMCSNTLSGREETRTREFRRCSVCSAAHYCSRACQAHHWKLSHPSLNITH